MKKITGILVLVALMAVTFSASAQTVFLGKGDVQTVLGLNNAQMNNIVLANGLTFTYETTDRYDVTIVWVTETGNDGEVIHDVTHHQSRSVSSTVAYEARKNANSPLQVTGFWLTFGNPVTIGGALPVVGQPYINPGNNEIGNGAIVTAVDLVSSTGGLFVNGLLIPTFILP